MTVGEDRWTRHDEQSMKSVPSVTSKGTFGQDVGELVLGVDDFHLNHWVQVDPVKQQIKSNSVGAGQVSQCRTSAFNKLLNQSDAQTEDGHAMMKLDTLHLFPNLEPTRTLVHL